MRKENGFSLVELLVVVIIIAIIAAIAIPNLLASRRAANEASAINSLRTVHSAQVTYLATDAAANYADALADLNTAGLIDSALSSGTKSGYAFVMGSAAGVYCADAAPSSTSTGTRGFAVSQPGVIYAYTTGAAAVTACAEGTGILTVGAGTAIQ